MSWEYWTPEETEPTREELKAEIERLREHLRIAIMSDSEECKLLTADNERLRAALDPFAGALEGNWSQQPDSLPIVAGYGAHDLRLRFTLGDFRRAHAALTAQPAEGEK